MVSAWLHHVLPGQTFSWNESLRGFPKEVSIWICLSKEDPPLLIWVDKIQSVEDPSKTQGPEEGWIFFFFLRLRHLSSGTPNPTHNKSKSAERSVGLTLLLDCLKTQSRCTVKYLFYLEGNMLLLGAECYE